MSATDLAVYVGDDRDQDFVEQCWDEAVALVVAYITPADDTPPPVIPPDVLRRAHLEVGAELYHRRSTKNGVAQFATPDAAPIRIARDPMVSVYPLLNRYVGGGFA